MAMLDFVMEPPFECSDDDAGDVAFIKATHCIGARDVVEEFMACGLSPLSTNFGLGEVVDRETPVSKLHLPLLEFPIARLPNEMNDHFRARVELAAENIVGSYTRGEHDVCIASVPNEGRVNWVFEQASVPYGPHLELGSEASKEAVRKRKDDAGTGPAGKHTKVYDWQAAALKASVMAKSIGAASSKAAPSKAVSSKVASSRANPAKADAAPKASAPPKAGAPVKAAVQKSAASLSVLKAGVLKVGVRLKWTSAGPAQTPKGK
jgi:hypothetical protein